MDTALTRFCYLAEQSENSSVLLPRHSDRFNQSSRHLHNRRKSGPDGIYENISKTKQSLILLSHVTYLCVPDIKELGLRALDAAENIHAEEKGEISGQNFLLETKLNK